MRWMERFIRNRERAVYVKDQAAQGGGSTTVRYLTREEYKKIRPNEAARHIEFIFHKGIALLVDWDIARVLIEKYKDGVTLQDMRGQTVEVTDDLTDLKHRDLMHLLGRYYRGAKAVGIKPPTVSGNYSTLRAKIRMLRMMNIEPAEDNSESAKALKSKSVKAEEKPDAKEDKITLIDGDYFTVPQLDELIEKLKMPVELELKKADKVEAINALLKEDAEKAQKRNGDDDAGETEQNARTEDQQEEKIEEHSREGGEPIIHEGEQTTDTDTTQSMNAAALAEVE